MPKKLFYLTGYSFKLAKNRQLILLTAFFLFLISHMMLFSEKHLIKEIGAGPESNAFALLWNNSFFLMLFFLVLMFAFSNVPFHDDSTPFVLIRTGKMFFACAQIIYIFILSCMLPVLSYFFDYLLFPYQKESGDWGRFWGTLAQEVTYSQNSVFVIDYRLMWDFNPQQALKITMLICILLCFMTGLFLYFMSLFHKTEAGVGILALLIIFSHVTKFFSNSVMYHLSPYSWLCLDIVTPEYNGILVSVNYAVDMLLTINFFLILVIFIKTYRTKEIL